MYKMLFFFELRSNTAGRRAAAGERGVSVKMKSTLTSTMLAARTNHGSLQRQSAAPACSWCCPSWRRRLRSAGPGPGGVRACSSGSSWGGGVSCCSRASPGVDMAAASSPLLRASRRHCNTNSSALLGGLNAWPLQRH